MKKRNKKIIAALSAIFGLLVIGALCWSFVLCYRTLHPPRLTDLSWLTRQYPHTTEWLDSIRSNGLLHDIVRLNADGERSMPGGYGLRSLPKRPPCSFMAIRVRRKPCS